MLDQRVDAIDHHLTAVLPQLARCANSSDLRRSSTYRAHETEIQQLLSCIEVGGRPPSPAPRKTLRLLSWNIERGKHLDGLCWALTEHPLLSTADVVMFQEVDLGMARSDNRHVVREIAERVGGQYYYVPGFLELSKGSGEELHCPGDNTLSLQGQALLSRVPVYRVSSLPLPVMRDRMRAEEKCIGCRRGLLSTVLLEGREIQLANIHIDHQTSAQGRTRQLAYALAALQRRGRNGPAVLCGDMNCTTYEQQHLASLAISGLWKVLCGYTWAAHHFLHPYEKFEPLFREAERRGFSFREANELGVGSVPFDVNDARDFSILTQAAPTPLAHSLRWALNRHGGKMPSRLDWFFIRQLQPLRAGMPLDNGLRSSGPKVISDVLYRGERISDHWPVLLDISLTGGSPQ